MPLQNIDSHPFESSNRLFLDANVWIYIYSPRETEDKHKLKEVYSAAFSRMLAAQSKLFTDVLIISEFVNTYARMKWSTSLSDKQFKNKFKNEFKKYRKSKQFKPVAKQIASAAKKITSMCQVLDSGFSQLPHHKLFESYATGSFDFNDQIFSELCRSERLTLVTHDGDFNGQGIPILTANQNLLRQKNTMR